MSNVIDGKFTPRVGAKSSGGLTSGTDGGDNNDMEARVAKLEAAVEHIQSDVTDIKMDIKDLRALVDSRYDKLDDKFEKLGGRISALIFIVVVAALGVAGTVLVTAYQLIEKILLQAG